MKTVRLLQPAEQDLIDGFRFYEAQAANNVADVEARVKHHIERMGFLS